LGYRGRTCLRKQSTTETIQRGRKVSATDDYINDYIEVSGQPLLGGHIYAGISRKPSELASDEGRGRTLKAKETSHARRNW
jgi:hypothetical protein